MNQDCKTIGAVLILDLSIRANMGIAIPNSCGKSLACSVT
jgi:hypothetical protein